MACSSSSSSARLNMHRTLQLLHYLPGDEGEGAEGVHVRPAAHFMAVSVYVHHSYSMRTKHCSTCSILILIR